MRERERQQHDGDAPAGFKHVHDCNASPTGLHDSFSDDRHCLCLLDDTGPGSGGVLDHLPDEAKGP